MRIGDELVGIGKVMLRDSSCILQDVRRNIAGAPGSSVQLILQRRGGESGRGFHCDIHKYSVTLVRNFCHTSSVPREDEKTARLADDLSEERIRNEKKREIKQMQRADEEKDRMEREQGAIKRALEVDSLDEKLCASRQATCNREGRGGNASGLREQGAALGTDRNILKLDYRLLRFSWHPWRALLVRKNRIDGLIQRGVRKVVVIILRNSFVAWQEVTEDRHMEQAYKSPLVQRKIVEFEWESWIRRALLRSERKSRAIVWSEWKTATGLWRSIIHARQRRGEIILCVGLFRMWSRYSERRRFCKASTLKLARRRTSCSLEKSWQCWFVHTQRSMDEAKSDSRYGYTLLAKVSVRQLAQRQIFLFQDYARIAIQLGVASPIDT